MKAFVAVTDLSWYRYLSERSDLDELNFWQPSGHRQFRALQIGEPFLFKLHSPRDFTVGADCFFARFSSPPASPGTFRGHAAFSSQRSTESSEV